MATRSAIGIENADGTVTAVYCHWDGYPENNGKILLEYYPETETTKLISYGDISSLGEKIDETTFYGRDRGEENIDAVTYANVEEYFNDFKGTVDYCYLLRNGNWTVSKSHNRRFVAVDKVLEQRERMYG